MNTYGLLDRTILLSDNQFRNENYLKEEQFFSNSRSVCNVRCGKTIIIFN